MENAETLLRGIDRLCARFGISRAWRPEGLEISSSKPIDSEFLPYGFPRGFCALPGKDLKPILFSMERPYFLMSFSTGPMPAGSESFLGSWNVWMKKCAGNTELRFLRVEEVPEMEVYRSFDPGDSLNAAFLDTFTLPHLIYPADDHLPPVGKARLTDLDHGDFLLSRPCPKNAPEIWNATAAWLASRGGHRLFLIWPDENNLPGEHGFQKVLIANIHGFT